jgi:hypothetical protein
MKSNYQLLLKHPKWFEKRSQIIKRDMNRCIVCGSSDKIEVHHRQYHFSKSLKSFVPPWGYKNSYLITLCNSCHDTGHKTYKSIPTFNIN